VNWADGADALEALPGENSGGVRDACLKSDVRFPWSQSHCRWLRSGGLSHEALTDGDTRGEAVEQPGSS
jgi:hypothetical protein